MAHDISKGTRTGDVLSCEAVEFTDLHLSGSVLEGLHKAGFKRPSPIQLKAIPIGRCGLDLIVQAKSGTGKTCVFSVIALESVDLQTNATQVVVIAPTREIAVQIQDVMKTIGSGLSGLICHTFIGGLPVSEDKAKLKKCHIAVGTPGRLRQLVEFGALKPETVRLLILDEADKLMEEGFQEQINWMYSVLPESKQMLALSATYPEVLAQHLTTYMRNPSMVRLNSSDPALLGIRQYYKLVDHHQAAQKAFDYKVEALLELLTSITFNQCLVFSNFQLRAESLSDVLNAKGWPATFIGGMLDQTDRLAAMEKLRAMKCRVLISTDLTSRGIDAENVNLVINLDIPKDHETYLHRIGRAGRFGTYGAGITLAAKGKGEEELDNIEKKCNTKIKPLPDPIPEDLAHSSGYVYLGDLVTTEKIITSEKKNHGLKTAADVDDNDSAVGSYPRQEMNGDANETDDDVFYDNRESVGEDEGIVDDVEDECQGQVKSRVIDNEEMTEAVPAKDMLEREKVEMVHYNEEDHRAIGQVKCTDCHTYSYIAVLDPEAELQAEKIHKCAYSEEFPSLGSGDESSDNDKDVISLQGADLKTFTIRGLSRLPEESCKKCFPEMPRTILGESIIEEEDLEMDDTASLLTETESEFDGPEPVPAGPGNLFPSGYFLQYDRATLLSLSSKPCNDCAKYKFSDFIDPIWKNGQPHKKYNPFNCKFAVRRKKSRTASESYYDNTRDNVRKTPPKSRSMSVGSHSLQEKQAKNQQKKPSFSEQFMYELDPAIIELISKVPEWNAPNAEAVPEVDYDELYLSANGSSTPNQKQFTSYQAMLDEMMKKGEIEKTDAKNEKTDAKNNAKGKENSPAKASKAAKGKAKSKDSPVNGGGDAKLKLNTALANGPAPNVNKKKMIGSEPIGVPAGGSLPSPSDAFVAQGMKPALIINYHKTDKKSRSSSHSTYPFGENSFDAADVISNDVSNEDIGEILGASANVVTTQIGQEYDEYDESFLFFENQEKSIQAQVLNEEKAKDKKKKKKSSTTAPATEKASEATGGKDKDRKTRSKSQSESFQFIPDNSSKSNKSKSKPRRKSSSSSTSSSLYGPPPPPNWNYPPPPYGYPPNFFPSMGMALGGLPNTAIPPPAIPPPFFNNESQYYQMQALQHEAYMRHFKAMYEKLNGKKNMEDELSLQARYINYMKNISRMLQLK